MGAKCIYTVRDYATGAVLAKGTARELEESGVVPRGSKTANWANVQNKLKNRLYLVEKEMCKPPKSEKKQRSTSRRPKARPRLKGIANPTPLDYDVHHLMIYNKAARKAGLRELNYGYWVAEGRPTRP